ncbi:MAG: glycerol kinase, partial [Micrococcales bacterium]
NQLLLEIQATQLNTEVLRPRNLESTSLGAAYLAGIGAGIFADQENLKKLNPIQTVVSPHRNMLIDRSAWNSAISKVQNDHDN